MTAASCPHCHQSRLSYTPVMARFCQVIASKEPSFPLQHLGMAQQPLPVVEAGASKISSWCVRRTDYVQHLTELSPPPDSHRGHSSSSSVFPQENGVACDKLRYSDFEARWDWVQLMSPGHPSYMTCEAHWRQNLPWVECTREKANE